MLSIAICTSALAKPLSLAQAEQMAISQAPELKQLTATQQAFEQNAIAAGQLSDPKLLLGAMNLPTDTFDLSQEPMTQLQVGLQQSFPRGHTLKYQSQEKQKLAQSEGEKRINMQAIIVREVRLNWLDLYYWLHVRQQVVAQKKIFEHLTQVTESLLINNKAQQKDVIRAQLETTGLDNQLLIIDQKIAISRAHLARWIGQTDAKQAHPKQLPVWKSSPTLTTVQHNIVHHPILQADQNVVEASEAVVARNRQQYIPGFSIGAAYGFRQGENIDGTHRADFLTAQVVMDLPLFPRNRQNREVRVSEASLIASQASKDSHYRILIEDLKMEYAIWQEQQKSNMLYKKHLIPEAKQYAEATLLAYQNDQTDFPTLARAYIRELDTKIGGIKAAVDQKKARVHLLYLEWRSS